MKPHGNCSVIPMGIAGIASELEDGKVKIDRKVYLNREGLPIGANGTGDPQNASKEGS